MIRRITVQNFRSFAEPTSMDMNELLVLAGANSSGKSSLIQVLLLLSQTLKSQNPEIALDLAGRYVQFPEFRELVFMRPNGDDIYFSVTFELTIPELDLMAAIRNGTAFLRSSTLLKRFQKLEVPSLSQTDPQIECEHLIKLDFGINNNGVPLLKAAKLEKSYHGFLITRHTIVLRQKKYNVTVEMPGNSVKKPIFEDDLIYQVDSLKKDILDSGMNPSSGLYLSQQLTLFLYQYCINWKNPPRLVDRLRKKLAGFRIPPTKFQVDDPLLSKLATFFEDTLAYFRNSGWNISFEANLPFDHFILDYAKLRTLRWSDDTPFAYPPHFNAAFGNAFREVRDFLSALEYIGPLRAKPERAYLAAGNPPDIGSAGENTIPILSLEQKRKVTTKTSIGAVPSEKKLSVAVGEWFQEFGLGGFLSITTLEGVIYQAKIEGIPNTGLMVTIADVGFGVSQLLPVVLASLRAPIGATLIFEQPELHLHPRLQGKLADFFICMVELGKKVIVETHSEHFINMLRLRIAEDTTAELHNKVGILFVRGPMRGGGSHVESLQVDEYGGVVNWPPDFFPEHGDITEKILRAMFSKHSRGHS